MNTSHQQNSYEKDATIRKQSRQIEKLQLEINALKIRLSGTPNDNGTVIEPILLSIGHTTPFWQEDSLLNRAG